METRHPTEAAPAFAGAAPRALADKAADVVSVRDAGLRGDDGRDVRATLSALIDERPPGAALYFPRGRYFLAGALDVVLTSPLELRLDAGAVLVGDATDVAMLAFRGGDGRHRFSLSGGQIDNGDRLTIPAKTSGTALTLVDIDEFAIHDVTFGRRGRHFRDERGDSGIAAVRVARGTISGCRFHGQPDLGIYLSGGAGDGSEDDGGDFVVVGNHFVACRGGCAVKRQAARTIYANNTHTDCANGFMAWDSGKGEKYVAPGRTGVVSGNVFKRSVQRAIEVRGDGWAITGNVIEDFGRGDDGGAVPALGIWLHGARDCVVTGNLIRNVDWQDHPKVRGIRVDARADGDGRTFAGGMHHIGDNRIQRVFSGFSETATDPSHYPGNTLLEVAEPATALDPRSEGSYWDGHRLCSFVDGEPLPEAGSEPPVLRPVAGVAAVAAEGCVWSRRGRIVTVAGTLVLREVAATAEVQLDLPIARAFETGDAVTGFAVASGGAGGSGRFAAVAGQAAVRLQLGAAASAASATWHFSLAYALPMPAKAKKQLAREAAGE